MVQRRDYYMMNYNPYGMPMSQGHDIKHTCHNLKNYYVIGQMHDGSQMEGIIEDMDDEGVTMLVPEEVEEAEMGPERQFGGYAGFGGYGGYGRRRFRRFRRRRFPYNFFVFPFFFPFPFYY
ncbi:hypothetical protein [Bacillus sp. REN16]|uniref:hypothetical protein n=1 Tax=Bacillus sp. REN16 TaxID=2887296 RepID=UPI001E52722B|nr:hypothetical protein [Bacillus sp. REN16]MCC3356989.1 hypothetical protein [Bacillus sp. REN16]